MLSEQQKSWINIIKLIKNMKYVIDKVILDRSLFHFPYNRTNILEGYHFLVNFNLDDDEDIASLDDLNEFNVDGYNPRKYLYEDTKKEGMYEIMDDFKVWYTNHTKDIKNIKKELDKNPHLKDAVIPINSPSSSPIYASPSSNITSKNASPIIFSREPSPMIRGQKSVRLPNPKIDRLECYFNMNNESKFNFTDEEEKTQFILSEELTELFDTNKEIDGIKFFKDTYISDQTHKTLYKKQFRKVLDYAKNPENDLCRELPARYVARSIYTMQMLLCLTRREKGKTGSRILGFSTIGLNPDGILYISILCASLKLKGGGTRLMEGIKQIGTLLKCNSIQLESVNNQNTINFYLKQNFIFTGMSSANKLDKHCNKNYNFDDLTNNSVNSDNTPDDSPDDTPDLCIMKFILNDSDETITSNKEVKNKKPKSNSKSRSKSKSKSKSKSNTTKKNKN